MSRSVDSYTESEPVDVFTESYARAQDEQDPLHCLRDNFFIPTKADLARKTLTAGNESLEESGETSVYLCGNSLGLQPKLTGTYIQQYLRTWASKGVYGHFTEVEDSDLAPWLHVDEDVLEEMGKIVGGLPSEVAVMQTLTANLHLMMASFYKPTKEKYKIILEGKAFPSDHYAVESHLRHHGINPDEAMVLIEPEPGKMPTLSTEQVLKVIDRHASETALLLLPGIQFYTGQFFDMSAITQHAQCKGLVVGWDLAHAAGNVTLQLHEWNVDFAVWCTYKYLNCGPGAIGGCFIHDRHGKVTEKQSATPNGAPHFQYQPRLSGWWGSSKSSRFAMSNDFHPIPGAAGFQLSNPSVADLTAVRASLDVFKQTSMDALRKKSLKLTKYLEDLLGILAKEQDHLTGRCFSIITPHNPYERGAQLSLLLKPGLLDAVMQSLEEGGVVVDERRPDVIRVAPAPLYNSYLDVFLFVKEFQQACAKAQQTDGSHGHSVMVDVGKEDKGWSEVK